MSLRAWAHALGRDIVALWLAAVVGILWWLAF